MAVADNCLSFMESGMSVSCLAVPVPTIATVIMTPHSV
jgi:hypothetical protein